MKPSMKPRSKAPIFWVLFGGGGTLAALFGPALVLITGWLLADRGAYARALAFAGHPLVRLAFFGLVLLLAWHAAHRLYKSLHDVGIPPGTASKAVCYGSAALITLLAAWRLLLL